MLIVTSLLVALVKSDLARVLAKEKRAVLKEDVTGDIVQLTIIRKVSFSQPADFFIILKSC